MITYGHVVFGILFVYLLLWFLNTAAQLRSATAGYSFVESQYQAQKLLSLPGVVFLIMMLIARSIGFRWAIGLLIVSFVLALISGPLSGSDDRFARLIASYTVLFTYCFIAVLPALIIKYNLKVTRLWYIVPVVVIVLIALKVARNIRSVIYLVLNLVAGCLVGGLAYIVGTRYSVALDAYASQLGPMWLALVLGAALNTLFVHGLTFFRPPFRN